MNGCLLEELKDERKLAKGRGASGQVLGAGGRTRRDQTPVPCPGRLSQEPGPDPQDSAPGGPARVSQLWLKRGRQVMGDFSRVP